MVESETKTETQYDLDMRIYKMLQDEPFFAILSRHLNKVATTTVATAGIRFNKDQARFELVYNPSFLAGVSGSIKIKHDSNWFTILRFLRARTHNSP